MTLPKNFVMFRASISGGALLPVVVVSGAVSVVMSLVISVPRLRSALADVVVDDHGTEEEDAQEGEIPVTRNAGEEDPLLRHPQGEGTEDGADGAPIASGEERPADDRGDDGLELLLLATEHVT